MHDTVQNDSAKQNEHLVAYSSCQVDCSAYIDVDTAASVFNQPDSLKSVMAASLGRLFLSELPVTIGMVVCI